MEKSKKYFVVTLVALIAGFFAIAASELFTQSLKQNHIVTGNEDHSISLTAASEFTRNFRKTIKEGDVVGGYFGEKAILDILNQEGAKGLRYYYAINEEGQPCLILIGIDESGEDMIDGLIAERSAICPPWCGSPNALNTNTSELSLSN